MAASAPSSTQCSLSDRIADAVATWSSSQIDIVLLAAELVDSPEWALAGSPTAAHHLAAIADVEPCTAREWIRVGRRVRGLPTIGRLFSSGQLSYSKVRALVAVATPDNEQELADIAVGCPIPSDSVRPSSTSSSSAAPHATTTDTHASQQFVTGADDRPRTGDLSVGTY